MTMKISNNNKKANNINSVPFNSIPGYNVPKDTLARLKAIGIGSYDSHTESEDVDGNTDSDIGA